MNGSSAHGVIAGVMLVAASAFAGSARAEPITATGLERPTSTRSAALPNDGQITCSYFPDLTVRAQTPTSESETEVQFLKAVDAPCKPGKAAGAPTGSSTTALLGRKGRLYVFGDTAGIDVFDLAARKTIHRGVVFRGAEGLPPTDAKGVTVAAEGDGLRLAYRHEVYETCSVLADRSCWGKLAKLAGLPADLAKQSPNCAAAYAKAKAQPDFTTAIGFRRDVTISADGKVTIAVSGPVECRSL